MRYLNIDSLTYFFLLSKQNRNCKNNIRKIENFVNKTIIKPVLNIIGNVNRLFYVKIMEDNFYETNK